MPVPYAIPYKRDWFAQICILTLPAVKTLGVRCGGGEVWRGKIVRSNISVICRTGPNGTVNMHVWVNECMCSGHARCISGPFQCMCTKYHSSVPFILNNKYFHLSSRSNLDNRTFKNSEFYAQYEDSLTPVGLAFFQSEWDQSVREVFHHILGTVYFLTF